MNARISQLWQRFRAPTKEFKRSHIEELFKLLREQQSQIEQLEAPVKEVMAQSEDFDGVNTIAYIRAMHKKMDGQRKHIAALEKQRTVHAEVLRNAARFEWLRANSAESVDSQQPYLALEKQNDWGKWYTHVLLPEEVDSHVDAAMGGHGNATTDADRQVGARTAGVPASDGDQACPAVPASYPAMRAYEDAMQAAGVPHEPLQVYESNSWRRVGLASQYREVMWPAVRNDHPDICGTDVLVALVAAFNVMLTIRPSRECTDHEPPADPFAAFRALQKRARAWAEQKISEQANFTGAHRLALVIGYEHGWNERGTSQPPCPECERLKQLLATTLDGEQGIHISTGGKSRDEKLFSVRDVQAFTAIGFALRTKHEAKRATHLREPPHCSTCGCGLAPESPPQEQQAREQQP